jgi:phosphoribosylpyrophosphate synthetase
VVHRDFASGTSQKIQDSKIEKFFTTDTIALRPENKFEKMVTCSVAGLIGESLKGFFDY